MASIPWNFIEQIKAPIFLEAVLAIQIMWEYQSNLKNKVKPSILKDDYYSTTGPSNFPSMSPVLWNYSNKTSWVFPALKSTSHFLAQSTVSCRSDSSSEANSICYHRWDADAGFYLLGGWEGVIPLVPPSNQKFAHSHPPWKIFPTKFLSPPPHQKSIPPTK